MKKTEDSQEKSKNFKSVIKKILAFFGASTIITLPVIGISKKEAKQHESIENTTNSFKNTIKVDENQLTVDSELSKITDEYTKTTHNYSKSEEQNSDKINDSVYNELLDSLKSITAQKKFDGLSYDYLKNFMDNVYKNYDTWKKVDTSLPNKKDYIYEHIINPINSINSINIYNINSQQAQKLLEEDCTRYAFTDSKKNITIIHDTNTDNFDIESERLGHELNHIRSKIINDSEYFLNYPYLKLIFTEGEATVGMKYSYDLNDMNEISNFFDTDYGRLIYKNNNHEGYPIYMNMYLNLQYFLGYDVMNSVSQGKIQLSEVEKILGDKYGHEEANKILTNLQRLSIEIEKGDKYENEPAIILQKEFINLIKNDISNLKTSKEYNNYYSKYNNYIKNNLVSIESDSDTFTYEYFHINELNKLLEEKLNEIESVR